MKNLTHTYDFVVAGGGLAGLCAAVTAARQGIRTALVHDRPVLGGNASTEIRVPPVGATQCNFAYSRETGLIEELYLNNLKRNPTCCQEGWNLELENLARNESCLDLFLNCTISDVELEPLKTGTSGNGHRRLKGIKAYCGMAETWHFFQAPLFADCTGDSVVGAQAGAIFRMGVEARSQFNESMCPEVATQETMGMSLHLHARHAGRPIPFIKPPWIKMNLHAEDFGPFRPVCDNFFPDLGGFWWLEWGGALDTVHDTLKIKEEVQRFTLATWDYLKNRSPLSEKLSNYELDWMGAVPGKRESRRLEGDHILTMHDIDGQVFFEDAIAYGGWGFDHHPPGGFHDKENPSTHHYLRGPHNVPLRSLYSRNVTNLFMAGRNISATHYALSSTRVMLTCAQLGEAVGMAAAHAHQIGCEPRQLIAPRTISRLQQSLQFNDHHIHAQEIRLANDIAPEAKVTASSVFSDFRNADSWGTESLNIPRMQLLPVVTSHLESVGLCIDASAETPLQYRFFQGPENGSTYPEREIASGQITVLPGVGQWVDLPLNCTITRPGWHFIVLEKNPSLRLHITESPAGYLRYYPRPEDPIRPNPFSKWTLRSLPIGQQKASDADGAAVLAPDWNERAWKSREGSGFLGFSYICRIAPTQPTYDPALTVNPYSRPTNQPNLWVSERSSFAQPEWIELTWDSPRKISRIQVLFDSSLHFHFSQSWQGYSVNAIPSLVKEYRIIATKENGSTIEVASVKENHHRNCLHLVDQEGITAIRLECSAIHGVERAQVYSVRVISDEDASSS